MSAGCKACYAETQSKRNPGVLGVWGPQGTRVVAAESYWRIPARWDRDAAAAGTANERPRPRVFCGSLMDWAEDWDKPVYRDGRQLLVADEEPNRWLPRPNGGEHLTPTEEQNLRNGVYRQLWLSDARRRMFATIDATPNLTWILLTKRPENIRRMWPTEDDGAGGRLAAMIFGKVTETGYEPAKGRLVRRRENCWLLTSVEDQAAADARIPHLLACRDLTPVLGLSVEPLLGPVDLDAIWPGGMPCPGKGAYVNGIDFVIVGCESGPHRRPCQEQWVRSIVEQCRAAGVACFVKQLDIGGKVYKDIEQFPEDLRVREFPRTGDAT